MGKARLLVELDVDPAKADDFVDMFKAEFIRRSRSEEGCEQYELWRDQANPARMTIIEVWTEAGDLDRHLEQPWFADWAPKMEAAQATPLVVRNMVSVED